MLRTRIHFVVSPIAVAVLAALASASTGRLLIGTVTDSKGAPLAGVTVTLFDVGGPPPRYGMDRSAVNAEGAGSEPYRSRSTTDYTEEGSTSSQPRKLLKVVTTDDKGSFTYNSQVFVGAVLARLEREGYQTEEVKFDFPMGTMKRSFTLLVPGEAPAIEAALRAAKSDDQRAVVWFNQAVALIKLEQWEKGRDALAEAVKLKPDFDNAWLNLAIASFQLGDFAGGLAAAEALLALKPDHPVAKMMVADAKARLAAGSKPAAEPAKSEK